MRLNFENRKFAVSQRSLEGQRHENPGAPAPVDKAAKTRALFCRGVSRLVPLPDAHSRPLRIYGDHGDTVNAIRMHNIFHSVHFIMSFRGIR